MSDFVTDLDNEFLTFAEVWPPDRKTAIVAIRSSRSGDLLGEIRWFGRWRQYAFFPEDGTIYNAGCMATIMARIDDLMERRTRV